jgi:hypothetical protein
MAALGAHAAGLSPKLTHNLTNTAAGRTKLVSGMAVKSRICSSSTATRAYKLQGMPTRRNCQSANRHYVEKPTKRARPREERNDKTFRAEIVREGQGIIIE